MRKIIDMNKIGDPEYLAGFTVGEIASQALSGVIELGVTLGKISRSEIEAFKRDVGAANAFKLNYPVLSSTKYTSDGYIRYYAVPIDCYGEELYLTNYWKEKSKDILIKWITEWVAKNIGSTPAVPPRKSAVKTSGHSIKMGKEAPPCDPPQIGEDFDGNFVKYKDVPMWERVPGLCGRLEEMYFDIIRFAKKLFGEHIGNMITPIPVELHMECPTKIYINSDEYVAKKVNDLIERGKQVCAADMAKIMRFEERILGTFHKREPVHINIYFKQVSADSWEEYIMRLVQTLAHEYMHYLEFAYCQARGKKSYQDARVSEAMADFFAVLYLVRTGSIGCMKLVKARYNAWVERAGSAWPYAYALYFLKDVPNPLDDNFYATSCVEKLIQVFLASPNGKIAYGILIS